MRIVNTVQNVSLEYEYLLNYLNIIYLINI